MVTNGQCYGCGEWLDSDDDEPNMSHEGICPSAVGAKQVKRKKPDEVQPRAITEFDDDELKDALQGYRMTDEAKLTCIDASLQARQTILNNADFQFPLQRLNAQDNNRKFQRVWLTKNDWLFYSTRDCGGYCLCCMLFMRQDQLSRGIQLVTKPLRNYKTATTLLADHSKLKYHTDCVLLMQNFRNNMQAPAGNILNQEISRRKAQVIHNRAKLKPILKSIITCGRQGLALRARIEKHYYSCSASEKRAATENADEVKQRPQDLLARTSASVLAAKVPPTLSLYYMHAQLMLFVLSLVCSVTLRYTLIQEIFGHCSNSKQTPVMQVLQKSSRVPSTGTQRISLLHPRMN